MNPLYHCLICASVNDVLLNSRPRSSSLSFGCLLPISSATADNNSGQQWRQRCSCPKRSCRPTTGAESVLSSIGGGERSGEKSAGGVDSNSSPRPGCEAISERAIKVPIHVPVTNPPYLHTRRVFREPYG